MNRTAALLLFAAVIAAGEAAWTAIPPAQWQGATGVEVKALGRTAAAAVAGTPLRLAPAQPLPAGLYQVRLTLRPSHSADATAWRCQLQLRAGKEVAASWPGRGFARAHEAEARTAEVVHAGGPLALALEVADPAFKPAKKDDPFADAALDAAKAVYWVLDQAEVRSLSRSGRVLRVTTDRIRYDPGATLKGTASLADVGGKGGSGELIIHLERGLAERSVAARVPVKLAAAVEVPFAFALPRDELGYAVVAEWVAGDDRSEAAEYVTIAENFQRVAMFGANCGGTRDVALSDEQIRKALSAGRADYCNTVEYPFWAPDDLLELTPDGEWWFSGQANYHMHKQTLQRQIALAHEQGLAMVTYGKWCVSGAPGWEAVYDRPQDFTGTYSQPIGSWDAHNAWTFDLRRNDEQIPYTPRPVLKSKGPAFDPWWNDFVGIGPNASLAMIRSAAEEMAASVDLFGWDAIRWDGHIRTGWNATGRSGQYDAWAARQTQTLSRYFKDVIAKKHPRFRHGYNYFLIEKQKGYEWAKEDFELDELASGGGLLMNESIGNASAGWTFAEIANNLQVEGDLARERGGFYLGISFANGPCDVAIESALWAAAGCRPYNGGMDRETRRYLTRFAAFTLDERLRRLAAPEAVLKPAAETKLWWQGFVYETPDEGGRRRLVVNLLNLPLAEKRPARGGKGPDYRPMPPGTAPVEFALNLPAGLQATGAALIDPPTLAVSRLPVAGGRVAVPAVATWQVLVIDLAVAAGAPRLADLHGAPKTLGVKREGLKDEQRLPTVAIDPTREVWEVNKNMAPLQPEWAVKREAELAALAALPEAQRIAALKERRAGNTPEKLMANWWKGGVLPDDLKRKDVSRDDGDRSPRRDGVIDLFHGRGAMDHRLRMPEAFARLDRLRIHDAPFGGSFRGGGLGGMWLGNGGLPVQRLPDYDLVVFTGIPYAAIGIDTCYALPAYVMAGGGVLFTGGEWAFGKGGYFLTVLERELLPVDCVELSDARTLPVDKPGIIAVGKDFAELGVQADFAAKPAFWVYNQVLLKEDSRVKVFLTSAQGPVLVGWQLGKGRVACLMLDHRGKSGGGVTAFFDWQDWPGLAAAVLRWLAPQAGTDDKQPAGIDATEAKRLLAGFGQAAEDAALGGTPAKKPAKPGKDAAAAIESLLTAPPAAVDAKALLDHVAGLGALPDALVYRLADWLRANPPADLAARRAAWLAGKEASLRFLALQLTTDPAVLREQLTAAAPPAEANRRLYALTLALPSVTGKELLAEGRELLQRWNAEEQEVRDAWTGGKGFSVAAPELPCLDAETLFRRIGWLAYLSRHDAAGHGAQFVREWLMTAVYQDYCGRSAGNRRQGDWDGLRAALGQLRQVARAEIERLRVSEPKVFAEGLAQTRYTREYLLARELLAEVPAASIAPVLQRLRTAPHRDLAAFATARLNIPKDR